jgi:hypothetical protein
MRLDKVCRAFVLGSVPFAVWLHVGDPVRAMPSAQAVAASPSNPTVSPLRASILIAGDTQ